MDVRIGDIRVGGSQDAFPIIAGPCVIESRDHTMRLAESISAICSSASIPLVFKASFDKANRSSIHSYRGPGMDEGLSILHEVKESLGLPVLTDIHEASQAESIGRVVDCIQIPAFLCRQTDLLVAAAGTGVCVNVKKGQFMSPEEMGNVVTKLNESGCNQVILTERGTFFGYNTLVNDMTSIPRMKKLAPVCYDATHSCQLPGGGGTQSGGRREYANPLASAALAVGADLLFMEVHDDPDNAKSDAATVYPLDQLATLLEKLKRIRAAVAG